MRMDQYEGLNEWAKKFVEGEPVFLYTERVTRTYPNGQCAQLDSHPVYGSSVTKEEIGHITGAWNDNVAPLHKYTFLDGRVYTEAIQAEPWSSGPCYFIALKDDEGNWVPESLWSDEEINDA